MYSIFNKCSTRNKIQSENGGVGVSLESLSLALVGASVSEVQSDCVSLRAGNAPSPGNAAAVSIIRACLIYYPFAESNFIQQRAAAQHLGAHVFARLSAAAVPSTCVWWRLLACYCLVSGDINFLEAKHRTDSRQATNSRQPTNWLVAAIQYPIQSHYRVHCFEWQASRPNPPNTSYSREPNTIYVLQTTFK